MLLPLAPFHVVIILILYVSLFLSAAYCIIRNRMSALWALAILFFPVVGSLFVLLYYHFNKKEKGIKS